MAKATSSGASRTVSKTVSRPANRTKAAPGKPARKPAAPERKPAAPERTPVAPERKPVAAVAGVSFTLYLTHQPLLLMWATLLDIDRGAWSGWWAVAALVGLSVWLTAQITEKRRGALRKAIARVLRRIGRDPRARLPA